MRKGVAFYCCSPEEETGNHAKGLEHENSTDSNSHNTTV